MKYAILNNKKRLSRIWIKIKLKNFLHYNRHNTLLTKHFFDEGKNPLREWLETAFLSGSLTFP